MKFVTYILISEVDNTYYIGQTQNLEKRILKHNNGYVKSTTAKRPWKVLHSKECESRSQAVKLEKYLKSLKKRSAIEEWIQKDTRGVAPRLRSGQAPLKYVLS